MYPRFSLQAVLDYRTSLVEALEIEHGRLLAALQRARQVLETLRETRRSLVEQLRNAQLGLLDLVHIDQLRVNIELIDADIEKQEYEVARLEKEVEAKRLELVQARQDEEVLVILKDKAKEQFEAEMKLREGRQQDDIYISSHYQKLLKEASQHNG